MGTVTGNGRKGDLATQWQEMWPNCPTDARTVGLLSDELRDLAEGFPSKTLKEQPNFPCSME